MKEINKSFDLKGYKVKPHITRYKYGSNYGPVAIVLIMDTCETWGTLSINVDEYSTDTDFVLNHDMKENEVADILNYLADKLDFTASYGFVSGQPVYRLKPEFINMLK